MEGNRYLQEPPRSSRGPLLLRKFKGNKKRRREIKLNKMNNQLNMIYVEEQIKGLHKLPKTKVTEPKHKK